MTKIRIYDLAKNLHTTNARLIEVLKELGLDIKSHSSTVDEETASLIIDLLKGEEAKKVAKISNEGASDGEAVTQETANKIDASVSELPTAEEVKPSTENKNLQPRAPIVTVLGHVDHGKTTLLDFIRKTAVAEKEKGGITQRLGASEIQHKGRKIVFIDTPGHEAFTAMRAQGAQVTDIAVLVVAADEGVMPQTIEALNHAKAAKVPVIVAVNKMDKEGANLDRVKQQLSDLGLVPEEWGGDTIFVPLSAKTGEGVDHLLEMISLMADILELKADTKAPASGTVIEARLDKGLGPVADVIIQSGTLRVGDIVQSASTTGKVRLMVNSQGQRLKEAGPSAVVEIVGLEDVPKPGEILRQVKEIKSSKVSESTAPSLVSKKVSLDQLLKEQEEEIEVFHLIIKADSQGTLDAVNQALKKLKLPDTKLEILHAGVGAINESDVNLASLSNAIILGFNVRPDPMAKKTAEKTKVEIYTYDLIYELTSELEKIIKGKLKPKWEEKILGRAVVRQVFRFPKIGTVAGSYVQEGKVARNFKVRVLRDNVVLYETKVSSLRRFKEDVREVVAGFECGIGLEKGTDLKEGDVLEFYSLEEV